VQWIGKNTDKAWLQSAKMKMFLGVICVVAVAFLLRFLLALMVDSRRPARRKK
jgi:hypothetical protein